MLRVLNGRTVLRTLLECDALTSRQLGSVIGLSKTTMSQILAQLQEYGLIVADGVRSENVGRAARLYRINPEIAFVAGLDITPNCISVAIADISGNVISRLACEVHAHSKENVVVHFRDAISAGCRSAGIGIGRLARIVVGIQGAIDPKTGRLGYAKHLPGWHVPHLVDSLTGMLGVPTEVENDVNLLALAELEHGSAIGCDNFALFWAAEGIGVALVLGGQLHRGSTGGAGELGYMPVEGAVKMHEVGADEDYGMQVVAGGPSVLKALRARGFNGDTPGAAVRAAVATLVDSPAGGRGPADAVEALNEISGRMLTGLAPLVSIIDPELIVLAGDTLLAGGERLLGMIERDLYRAVIPRPRLLLSSLGNDAIVSGALSRALDLAREEVFSLTDWLKNI
ncbi:ROK family protein [Streptosporangium sp. NPDC000396]|uniref:ROK family transcriptional regulator n=1 Tax=Streptosporangium sp. NPDC000396 TaxID=3366185 RepID=UPI00368779A5